MEDMTFDKLNDQIKKTDASLKISRYNNTYITEPEHLILENQLIIMKVLDKMDDRIRTIPR
jgi:hypothetical protein